MIICPQGMAISSGQVDRMMSAFVCGDNSFGLQVQGFKGSMA